MKIVTFYLNNPEEPMIRVALEDKKTRKDEPISEIRQVKNSLLNGIPVVIKNPQYATWMNDDRFKLQDKKKGLEIFILPQNVTHFYVQEYKEI